MTRFSPARNQHAARRRGRQTAAAARGRPPSRVRNRSCDASPPTKHALHKIRSRPGAQRPPTRSPRPPTGRQAGAGAGRRRGRHAGGDRQAAAAARGRPPSRVRSRSCDASPPTKHALHKVAPTTANRRPPRHKSREASASPQTPSQTPARRPESSPYLGSNPSRLRPDQPSRKSQNPIPSDPDLVLPEHVQRPLHSTHVMRPVHLDVHLPLPPVRVQIPIPPISPPPPMLQIRHRQPSSPAHPQQVDLRQRPRPTRKIQQRAADERPPPYPGEHPHHLRDLPRSDQPLLTSRSKHKLRRPIRRRPRRRVDH